MQVPSYNLGNWLFGICLAVVLFLIAFAIWDNAKAHTAPTGWEYDLSCCSNRDCAPVADGIVDERQDGVHVKGFGVMSYSDPRLRWSRDDQDHMCVTQSGEKKLLCVYRKPKGF